MSRKRETAADAPDLRPSGKFLSVLVVPFLTVGFGYALMGSRHIAKTSLTRDQSVPFSHEHHV